MRDRFLPKLAAERQQSELPSDFSRQGDERRGRFGHEVDDALLELAHSRKSVIERLGPCDQSFELVDFRSGQIGRRKEWKHERQMRRNAGRSAWVVLHPELPNQVTGPMGRDQDDALELILQSLSLVRMYR